jgi:anhydro-N-acetylmuramic acid kinase
LHRSCKFTPFVTKRQLTLKTAKKYQVLGVMSGTSLDGLDLALCRFTEGDTWGYTIERATTVPYPQVWQDRLRAAHQLSGEEFIMLDRSYAQWTGEQIRLWLQAISRDVNFVSMHGHTIFHRPEIGVTSQIGHPAVVAAISGCDVVGDFRVSDVALGGQGAPLVPIGDELLFHEYTACLNLGGFANISMNIDKQRRAWDVCPVNFVLNHLARRTGAAFDSGGELTSRGNVDEALLSKLERHPFFAQEGPKSLGREWVEQEVLPLMVDLPIRDLLRTYTEHIVLRIQHELRNSSGKLLVTGGGIHNSFLRKELETRLQMEVVVPSNELIDFKEALIFAFLGVLRYREEVNVLASVTGAVGDHCAGSVFLSRLK